MNSNQIELILSKTEEIVGVCSALMEREKLHKIDVDLLLSKIREMYDYTLQIETFPESLQTTEPMPEKPLIQTPPILPSPEMEEETELVFEEKPEIPEEPVIPVYAEPKVEILTMTPNKEEPKKEPVIEEIKPREIIYKTEVVTAVPEPEKTETSEGTNSVPEPVIQAITEEVRVETPKETPVEEIKNQEQPRVKIETYVSVHDKIVQNTAKEDFASKLQNKPLTDIGEGVNLSEKYYFVNELFGKNPDKYAKTVAHLNTLHSYIEAEQYLKEKFNWNLSSEPAQKFMDLLRRKYK